MNTDISTRPPTRRKVDLSKWADLQGYQDPFRSSEVQSLERVVGRVIKDMIKREANESPDSDEVGWGHMPYSPWIFTSTLAKALCWWEDKYTLPSQIRFLDVGCGLGTRMAQAWHLLKDLRQNHLSELSMTINGIELLKPYQEITREFFGRSVVGEDALQFNGYGDYNLIYFYWPIKHSEKEIEFEKRLVRQIKPGTMLIGVHNHYIADYANKTKRLVRLSSEVMYKPEVTNA